MSKVQCCHSLSGRNIVRLQVAQGKVRNVTAENAAQLMQEGWVLLDVRPQSEIEKAGVKGAVEVLQTDHTRALNQTSTDQLCARSVGVCLDHVYGPARTQILRSEFLPVFHNPRCPSLWRRRATTSRA